MNLKLYLWSAFPFCSSHVDRYRLGLLDAPEGPACSPSVLLGQYSHASAHQEYEPHSNAAKPAESCSDTVTKVWVRGNHTLAHNF